MAKFYIVKPGDLAHARITKALEIERNAENKCNEFLKSQGIQDKKVIRSNGYFAGIDFGNSNVPEGWTKVTGVKLYICYRPTRKYTSDVYDLWKEIPSGLHQHDLLSFIATGKRGTLYFNSYSLKELDGVYYLSIGNGNISTSGDNDTIEKFGKLTPVKESEWLIAQGR